MTQPAAFLFPGQGRLPKELPPGGDANADLFDAAEKAGLPLRAWIVEGNVEALARTEATQPTLLIDSLARLRLLRNAGWVPTYTAGHSLGEYGALVGAGVLTESDALRIVVERGRLMNGVEGAMAAIVKLDLATVTKLCDDNGPDVFVANHNGDAQVVVSGSHEAVQRVTAAATKQGGRGIPLKVSGPFHTPFMQPAQDALAEVIESIEFHSPACPVVSSVSGQVEHEADRLKDLLLGQITACVRWVDVVRTLLTEGVARTVEVGSGDVLTGLGHRITDEIEFFTIKEVLDGGV